MDTLKSEWIALTTIGICIVLVLLAAIFSDLWFLPIIATLMCSITIIKEIISDISRSEISAVMLATAALIAGLILGEYIIAAEIAIVIAVGSLLETVVADHATSSIQALGKVKTQRAHVINGNNIYNLPLEDVRVGKHIRIYPGEIIPLDGIIIQGDTSVDKSIMTGESIPVDAGIGDEVFSGTCNLYGTIDIEVTRGNADGMLGHMSSLLKYADAGK
ncbi:MAG: cation-translocating P-type ATPase, partial [Candidatus Methanomethylophilaceae archaeon]|nr:cation-translocating P-type ATPase [Candidatus Methanomethylophilaceae archaeon]